VIGWLILLSIMGTASSSFDNGEKATGSSSRDASAERGGSRDRDSQVE
jgi:hypothetical protein